MTAGPKYEFLWADGKVVKKPIKFPSPVYHDLLRNWTAAQFKNASVFPPQGQPFPPEFGGVVSVMARRWFRIYAHYYYSHWKEVQGAGAEERMHGRFLLFYLFTKEFGLLSEYDMAPLRSLVEHFEGMTVAPVWSPSNHFRFPKEIRMAVKGLLSLQLRDGDNKPRYPLAPFQFIPNEIMFLIIEYFCPTVFRGERRYK